MSWRVFVPLWAHTVSAWVAWIAIWVLWKTIGYNPFFVLFSSVNHYLHGNRQIRQWPMWEGGGPTASERKTKTRTVPSPNPAPVPSSIFLHDYTVKGLLRGFFCKDTSVLWSIFKEFSNSYISILFVVWAFFAQLRVHTRIDRKIGT